MNKQELIDAIAKETKLSKADAKKALEAILFTMKSALKRGNKINLVGYGSLSVIKRKARIGRNPQTGKEISIPSKNVVKFKAGTELSKIISTVKSKGRYADGGGPHKK